MLRLAVGGLIAFTGLLGTDSQAQAQETRTYRIEARGVTKKQVFLLVAPDGRLAAGRDDLTAWGLIDAVGPRARVEGLSAAAELYWLEEIAGIHVEIDEENRIVRLDPSPETLDNQVRASRVEMPDFELRRGWGADLTYRASALSRQEDTPLIDVRGKLGISLGDFGRVEATLDVGQRAVTSVDPDGNAGQASQTPPLLRDVGLRRDFGAGYVLHAGQLGAAPGSHSSGLRYLGASVGANVLGRSRTTLSSRYTRFEDLVTLAQPATVEVRVNGRVVTSRAVGIGRLSVSDIPIDAGDNDVQIMIRHADGRVEVFDESIVGGVDFIGAGLHEVGAAAGVLAESEAHLSDRYRDPFGSLYYARGVTEDHTVRVSSEGRVGANAHWAGRLEWASRLPGGVLASVGIAASASRTAPGSVHQAVRPGEATPVAIGFTGPTRGVDTDLQLERTFDSFRFGLGGSTSTERYVTMRQDGFAREPLRQGRADWMWHSSRGTIGLRYRYSEEWEAQGAHSGFASMQRRVAGGSLRLQAGYDGRPTAGGLSGSIGVTLGIGRGGSLTNLNVRTAASGTESSVRVSKSLSTNARGLAWSLRASRRSSFGSTGPTRPTRSSGEASVRFRNGLIEVRGSARNTAGAWSGNGEVAGSLVFLGGRVFTSAPIGSSYILIEAGGVDGISVMQNRRSVGETDRRGGLFVPYMPSLSTARIELDPVSFGAGLVAERLRQEVTLAPGASKIAFSVRRSLQAVLTLLDGEGVPWPAGTVVRGGGGRVVGIVGKDGLAQLTDLRVGEPLLVAAGPRLCTLLLELDGSGAGALRLGEVRCGE